MSEVADRSALRAANEAFYAAFRARDAAAMERLWASESAVACIHPGWDALHGREAVLSSWRRIFLNPSAPALECSEVQVEIYENSAVVICREGVPGQEPQLIATNLFVREPQGWRIRHHHAGPLSAPTRRREADPSLN